MKKGNIKMCAVSAVMVLLLTGCGSSIPDMTEEQESMVGEYAAMALLRHDANHRSRLVSYEEVQARNLLEEQQEEERRAAGQQSEEESSEGMDPVDDTPVTNIGQETDGNAVRSLEEFLGMPEGITVAYNGNSICDSYPEGEEEDIYFSLDASAGKHLLVLNFTIGNQSQAEQSVDLLSQNMTARVTVNGSYSRNALTTMLMDDLLTYAGSIPSGSSVNVVLLVELDSDVAENVSTVSLTLANVSDKYTVQLQ